MQNHEKSHSSTIEKKKPCWQIDRILTTKVKKNIGTDNKEEGDKHTQKQTFVVTSKWKHYKTPTNGRMEPKKNIYIYIIMIN